MFAENGENGVPSHFRQERIGIGPEESAVLRKCVPCLLLISSPRLNRRPFREEKQIRSRASELRKSRTAYLLQRTILLHVTVYVTRAWECYVPLHRSIDHSADQSPSLTVSIRSSPSLFPSCNGSPLESCIMFQFGSCIIDSSWRGLAHSLTPRVFRPRVRFRPPCHFGINHPRSTLVKSTRVDIASRSSTKYNKYVKV